MLSISVSFLFNPDINKIFKPGLVKYQLNHTKNWGPKAKAKVKTRENGNQNPA